MKIGNLRVTGKIGEGLACRWALHHEIYVGSRDIKKAENTDGAMHANLQIAD